MATDSNSLKYYLFAGCTIQNRYPFLEKSARFVFEKLGVELKDTAFGCCPDPVGIQSTDQQAWLTLGARNLSLVESEIPIVSLCNGCTETLKAVNHELNHNANEMKLVNSRLSKVGKQYGGQTKVRHFVEVLHDDIGIEKIKSLVVKPLDGLTLAVHVGCHYNRPSKLLEGEDAFDPLYAKELCRALGIKIVDYDEENLCCSAGVARISDEISHGMLKKKFESILEEEAEGIVVNCPTCFQTLEGGQKSMKKTYEMEVKLPLLYLTELMALAFGADPKELGLKFHMVKPMNLLKSKGIME